MEEPKKTAIEFAIWLTKQNKQRHPDFNFNRADFVVAEELFEIFLKQKIAEKNENRNNL